MPIAPLGPPLGAGAGAGAGSATKSSSGGSDGGTSYTRGDHGDEDAHEKDHDPEHDPEHAHLGEKAPAAAADGSARGVPGAGAGGGAPGGPPAGGPGRPRKYSHGFFDPELKPLRGVMIKIIGGAFVILTAVMWVCLPVYWGSLWKSASYTNKLRVLVVDFDSPSTALANPLGAAVVAATRANAAGVVDNVGAQGVVDAVYEEKAWAAVVVHAGATANLLAARQNGNTSYSPRDAVTFIYEQGRNEQAAGNYIVPIAQSVLSAALAQWNAESVAAYISSNYANATAMQALASAPETVSPGTAYALDNIRPFTASVATAIELVGLIYLLIFAFVMTMNLNAVRDIIGPFLRTSSLLQMRVFVPLFLYFWISLVFSMINLPFKVPFGAHFSYGAGWAVWWMLLWVGMAALGFATEFFITILGPKFVAFSLVVLIIFNVSVAALPAELMPWFYRYQPASIFFQLNRAVRTIIFDTKNHIGESVGVLFAWVVGSICTTLLATWLFRRAELKKHHKQMQEEQNRQA